MSLGWTLIIVLAGLQGAGVGTHLIFHDSAYARLYQATLFMVLATTFFTILHAFYRGMGRMGMANLWQLALVALGPLPVAWLLAQPGNSALIFFGWGLLTSVAAIPLAIHALEARRERPGKGDIRAGAAVLARYSAPRTIGGLALSGILGLGPLLAPYYGSLKDAGYLYVGQALFRVVESGVVGFGLVALPKTAELVAEHREHYLRGSLADLMALVFHVGMYLTIHLYLWSDCIVRVWLGGAYLQAIPVMRITVLALVPYVAYVGLRSVIDAVEESAINTANLLIALALTSLASIGFGVCGGGVAGLAWGMVLGILVLGALSVLFLWRRCNLGMRALEIPRVALSNLVLLGAGITVKAWGVGQGSTLTGLGGVAVIEGVFFLLYLYLLKRWRVGWIAQLERRAALRW
jgi:O-antigen/teichoic acid export membrane protein